MNARNTWTKSALTFLMLTVMFAAGHVASAERARPDQATVAQQREAGQAANAFAVDMYQQFAGEEGNIFFSPFSVSTALGMTSAGAKEQTLDEMLMALRWTADGKPAPMHEQTGTLLASLNKAGEAGDFQLAVANRLWVQEGYQFLKPCLDLVEKHYGADPEAVDYTSDAEGARKKINTWVEEQTSDRIKDLIPSGALTPLTRLVLTNAIYFKGDWVHQFDKKNTKAMSFLAKPGKSSDVPMMYQKEKFSYREDETAQVLTMPYAGRRLAMTVILPKEKNGLAALEKNMTAKQLTQWLSPSGRRDAKVWLPKFKMDYSKTLNEPLQAMGMKRAFDIPGGSADFSGMTPKPELYITAVVHKAFVEVNEEGSEAAAATGVIMATRAAMRPQPVVEFKADHPFLFVIKDNISGAVLFMGRYAGE